MSKPHLQLMGGQLSTEGWVLMAAFAALAAMRQPAMALRPPTMAVQQPATTVWQSTPVLRQPAVALGQPATAVWQPATILQQPAKAASGATTHGCYGPKWQKVLRQRLSCC